MTAITISRQLGSHGGRVARRLAKELGWELVVKSTINEVISQYGLIRLNDIYGDQPPKLRELFNQNTMWTIQWMNKTIATIAATRDVVILGRGGFVVLQGMSDVLNVFVKAPEDVRAVRIGKRDGLPAEQVADKVAADDKARESFVRRFYGQKWSLDESYDLVVDTGELSDDEAVARIIEEMKAHTASSQGPSAKNLDVDPVLLETIDQVLASRDS